MPSWESVVKSKGNSVLKLGYLCICRHDWTQLNRTESLDVGFWFSLIPRPRGGGVVVSSEGGVAAERQFDLSCDLRLTIGQTRRNWRQPVRDYRMLRCFGCLDVQMFGCVCMLCGILGGGVWEMGVQLHKITYIHCSLHLQFVCGRGEWVYSNIASCSHWPLQIVNSRWFVKYTAYHRNSAHITKKFRRRRAKCERQTTTKNWTKKQSIGKHARYAATSVAQRWSSSVVHDHCYSCREYFSLFCG